MMISVLVDLLFFTGTRGGMESYVRELYARMPREGFRYVALASRELAVTDTSWFPGEVVDSGISASRRVDWALGEILSVPRWSRRLGSDVIHSPANIGPWFSRTPVVLTIQDLLPYRHPGFIAGRYGGVLRSLLRFGARHAVIILTISAASKADIQHYLKVPPTKIVVTPLAGPPPQDTTSSAREPAMLLALGNRLPHKNFERLLNALALIPPAYRPTLVITGGPPSDPLRVVVDHLGLSESVTLLGWVTQTELDSLYQRASAAIVPTLFEGFGLPLLEAMARGCPVICSDLPVLREVAGDAAIFFDPLSPRAISEAIVAALSNHSLLRQLQADGLLRARQFSWDATAQGTAEAFQRAST